MSSRRGRTPLGGGRAFIALGLVALAAGCSRKVLEVLVDLPESDAEEQPVIQQPAAGTGMPLLGTLPEYLLVLEDTVTPELELALDSSWVVDRLPRDHAGNIDWVAALREGTIKPRDGIDGPRTVPPNQFEFGFDFYFPGPTEMFDAYFPHSVHTEIMECAMCHPRIFKARGTEIKMADVLAGRYCGECHGKVAFPPATACERCHTELPQPPDRVQPELIGNIRIMRITEIDSTVATVEGNATGVLTAGLARARFPHWVHRIRYRCTTCHMAIFVPKAGANQISMVDINEGRFCGRCHNGDTAFPPTMSNCGRCHINE